MRILFALAAAIGILSAQTAQKPGRISGTVLSVAGEPIRKAEVILVGGGGGGGGQARGSSIAVADAEGRFLFPQVRPGRYMLTARRAGFIAAAPGSRLDRANPEVTVADGQDLSSIVIRLLPQAVITGRVVDEDGDPVQHVNVQAVAFRTVRGRRQLISRGGAQTNDIGEYRIASLMPGKVFVYAMRQGSFQGLEGTAAIEEGYPLMFYPGATDVSQAMPMNCAAGNEIRGIDFRLRRVRTFHIRGQVTDFVARERTGPHFAVYAIRTGSVLGTAGPNGGAQVGENGRFNIGGLTPGSYTVMASRMVQGRSTTVSVPVELGNQNVEGVSITIGDGFNLNGVLKWDEGASGDLSKVRVVLEPLENPIGGTPTSQSAANGGFQIVGVSPARYRVAANGLPPNTYIKSIRSGQQMLGDALLDMTAGGAGDLEIVVSDKAARITGAVLDEKQQKAANVNVVLLPDGERRGQYRFEKVAITDAEGAFSFSAITPGEYLVWALSGFDEGAWDEPEFLQRYESRAKRMKVTESAAENLQLTVLTAERQ